MTYLTVISHFRRAIDAEIDKYRAMQKEAIEEQLYDRMRRAQRAIDALEVKRSTLDELEEIYKRK